MPLPTGVTRRRLGSGEDDIFRYERALARSGFGSVVGVDEAGRGACAGPLVVGAAVLVFNNRGHHRDIAELADSKLISESVRERVYARIVKQARAWSVVVIDSAEVDRIGLHVANIQGMRQALARLDVEFDYVLSDGFPVPGVQVPNLGVWKGDRVCGSVAAAGVLAKVTRDRIMCAMDQRWPMYGFAEHKGYVTADHRAALAKYGPAPVHRRCFEPVRRAAQQFEGAVDVTERAGDKLTEGVV